MGQMRSFTKGSCCCWVPKVNTLGVTVVTVSSGSKVQYYQSKVLLLLLLLGPPGEHPGGYGGDGV